jgi:hypothetical protein
MDKLKNPTTIIIFEALLIGVLLFLLVSSGAFVKKTGVVLPAQEAGQNAVNYINERFIKGENKAVLEKVEEESGLYKITIKIGENEYSSYITKDGRYLFPEAIDLKPPEPKSFTKTQKPDVKLFVMSFCPFGNQAEEMMMPVVDLLKDKADIELHYIIYSNYGSGYPEYCLDEENKYCSMHGIQELNQNVRELCVWKYQKEKFWDFVKEINQKASSENVDSKWESIAQDLGIDVQKIKDCQKNEAIALLEKEVQLTSQKYPVQDPSRHPSKKIPISGSPTLLINGMIYDGQRSSEDFKSAICLAFSNPPEECNQTLSETQTETEGSCK